MTILTLNVSTIRDKQRLVSLYLSQFKESYILHEINKIVFDERTGLDANQRRFVKRLSSREILLFIYKNGAPDNYVLSQEMQVKLADLREDLALKRSSTAFKKQKP